MWIKITCCEQNHVHSESCLSHALQHLSFTISQCYVHQIHSVVILWTLVFTREKKYLTSELVNWCAHDKLSCGDDSRPLPLKGQTQAMEYHFITAVFPCPVTATSMTTPFYAYCFNQLMVCDTNYFGLGAMIISEERSGFCHYRTCNHDHLHPEKRER